MTDITELAQREKFEAWWERTQYNGNPPRFGWECWRDGEGYKVDDDESELDGMWEAWKAAGAELVEALEKAQHEAAVDWEAAASLNVENQDLKRRIAELQSSHAKLRDVMASIHNTIRMDGAYTPLAAILNAAKRADEESASAAGIKLDVQPAQSCEHSMFWDASGVKRCSKCDRAEPGSRTVTVKLPKRITNIDLRTPLEVEDMWIARIKEMLATAGIREAE